MKSWMIPLISFLSGGIAGVLITAMSVGQGETPVATNGEGRENAAVVTARGDVEQTTSAGAKVMNANRFSAGLLDVGSPGTWEATVSEAQKKQRAIAAELMKIARDETESDRYRREAIFQLGRMDDRTAIEFLVKNVALYLPPDDILGTIRGDDDALKLTPCQYTLVFSGNWRVAQLVLESMNAPKSRTQRIYLAYVLEVCLGRNVAPIVVDEQLYRSSRSMTTLRKENLEAIKTILAQ